MGVRVAEVLCGAALSQRSCSASLGSESGAAREALCRADPSQRPHATAATDAYRHRACVARSHAVDDPYLIVSARRKHDSHRGLESASSSSRSSISNTASSRIPFLGTGYQIAGYSGTVSSSSGGREWRRARRGVITAAAASSGRPSADDGSNLRSLVQATLDFIQRRWRNVRRRVFVKVLVLLAGFFSANALSTIVGQTGDWDVLVAGSLVASLELLGACLYRLRLRAASAAAADAAKLAAKSAAAAAAAGGRGRRGEGRVGAGEGVAAGVTGSGGDVEGDEGVEKGEGALVDAVALVNFWKAGIILGLFVDAFKVGS
ncbi:unnamed protein product [Closterium sp. NIES-53]